jgi:hypothetical protein
MEGRTGERPTEPINTISADSNKGSSGAPEGRISLTPEGWLIEYGGKRVVIFDDIRGVSCNIELAKALGVEPPKAWAIKEQLLENWSPTLDEVRYLFPRIVGEDDNVKLAILGLFTLKLKDPGERLMGVIVEGSNSVGKSHFSKNILKPLQMERIGPEEKDTYVVEFTRVTGAFLERALANKNLDRRILFMQEVFNAPYQLHLTLSEGRLKIGIVERQDGGFKPVEIEALGQPFLWATSTEWHGSPDLIHRCIVLTMDESIQQTRRITEFQAKLSSNLSFRRRMEEFERGCIKIFQELWRSAPDNCIVIIPYIELIQRELVKTDLLSVKFRRDFNKLISLVKGCAILNHRRRVKANIGGETVIIASFEDFLEVYKLMRAALRPTLTGLNEKDLKVLEALRELENTMELPTYSALAKKTGIPSSTIRHHVAPKLESLGFIAIDREARPHKIELLRDGPGEMLAGVEGLREEAEKLIKDAVAGLSPSSGGGLDSNLTVSEADGERSPERASNREKEPGSSAILNFSNDPGSSSQKEPEEPSILNLANDLRKTPDRASVGEKEPGSLAITPPERSPDRASVGEKEPGSLAKLKMANDLSFSEQKEPESSPVHDWPIGLGENKEYQEDFIIIHFSGGCNGRRNGLESPYRRIDIIRGEAEKLIKDAVARRDELHNYPLFEGGKSVEKRLRKPLEEDRYYPGEGGEGLDSNAGGW